MLPGAFDSPESRTAFAQLQLELETAPLRTVGLSADTITMNEVLLAFLDYAEGHYLGEGGEPTREVEHIKTVNKHVRELYGTTPATSFGPLALKAIRQRFISLGWCRKMVNQQIERLRRIVKWAAGEELIPFEVYQRLTAVSGLKKGRCDAKERDPVLPVADVVVDATLPHLNRHIRGLVEFQRLTGCRPGEARSIRRSHIELNGPVWLYRPPHHKNTHRGKTRTISVGPQAQALLRQFFTADIDDYLFSPTRAVEEFRGERSAKRKTPRYPSSIKRNEAIRVTNPKRVPKEKYTRLAYIQAVTRACDRAFPPVGELAQQKNESAREVVGTAHR